MFFFCLFKKTCYPLKYKLDKNKRWEEKKDKHIDGMVQGIGPSKFGSQTQTQTIAKKGSASPFFPSALSKGSHRQREKTFYIPCKCIISFYTLFFFFFFVY